MPYVYLHKYAIRRCRILVNVIINSHVRFKLPSILYVGMLAAPFPMSQLLLCLSNSFWLDAMHSTANCCWWSCKWKMTSDPKYVWIHSYRVFVSHIPHAYWLFHLSLWSTKIKKKLLLTHSHLYSFIRIYIFFFTFCCCCCCSFVVYFMYRSIGCSVDCR